MQGDAVRRCPKSKLSLGLLLALQLVQKMETPAVPAGVSGEGLSRLGLHRRDGNRVDDVFGFAAAGKIVCGFVEALENWSNRGCARESFGEFVRDVT